jgi:hypothetical protein
MPPDYYFNFEPLLVETFNSYNNINVFVDRPKAYSEIGRNQTLEEAQQIDSNVLELLDKYGVPYIRIPCETDPAYLLERILEISS